MYGDDVAITAGPASGTRVSPGWSTASSVSDHTAWMSHQREYGLSADGICGPETLRSLFSRSPGYRWVDPRHSRRRAGASFRPRLSGKRIIIDPGGGGTDHGQIVQGRTGRPVKQTSCGTWQVASKAG